MNMYTETINSYRCKICCQRHSKNSDIGKRHYQYKYEVKT